MRRMIPLLILLCFPVLGHAQAYRHFTLKASGADTATVVGTQVRQLGAYNHFVVTWEITAADRADADETYDMYVTCGDGITKWDVVHFPQIATTGAKTYVSRIVGGIEPTNVTTAGPGVSAVETATMKTDTAGADQGVRTLSAGQVRHGPCGDRMGYELVISGTSPSITSSITVIGKQ